MCSEQQNVFHGLGWSSSVLCSAQPHRMVLVLFLWQIRFYDTCSGWSPNPCHEVPVHSPVFALLYLWYPKLTSSSPNSPSNQTFWSMESHRLGRGGESLGCHPSYPSSFHSQCCFSCCDSAPEAVHRISISPLFLPSLPHF